MSDIEFVEGLIVKAPNPKAPEFVKGSLSIKRLEMIAWLEGRTEEWINIDMKEAKSGKLYASVNSFKPDGDRQHQESPRGQKTHIPAGAGFDDDEIVF